MKNLDCREPLPWLVIGAFMTALTLVLPVLGFLEWFSMIPLFMGAYRLCESEKCTVKRAYRYGFLTVYAFYFVIYHWIVNLYPLDFIGMDAPSSAAVVAVGWLGLPLLQAIPGGLVFVLFHAMHRSSAFRRIPLLRPLAFSALWVVFEWSATFGWTGVPWGRLCLGQIHYLPILQSASVFGSYFVSFMLLTVNGFLAYALLYRARVTACAVTAAALFVSNFGFGVTARLIPDRTYGEPIRAAVIQGNISSYEKWSSDVSYIKSVYGDLTRKAAADGAELVIWPESTLPYDLSYESSKRRFVCELAKECQITLVVGALYYDDADHGYNVLLMVDPDGTMREEFYAKRHLVPFGEYVPMRKLITTLVPPLAELSALGEDLSPGVDSALFESKWGEIGSLICFDSIYEQLTLESLRDGADLMIISSNDSWFYDSAAVYQHQAQGQLRAIESGRYILRSANTGISSVISPKGDLLSRIDPLESGYSVATVYTSDRTTPYTVIGNLFVYLCILFVLSPFCIEAYGAMKKRLEKGRKQKNESL